MSHSANLLGALKETYLTKCGGSHKSWKTRWFVLTKDNVYYFDREISTQPLGVIPLKDYCKCKGMEGDAFQMTKKDNSFYLQMPYRTYKMYATEWRTSEDWAESISAVGDFIRKKEDIRNPSALQQTLLINVGDILNYGSSLIHWFKLVVDSTPTYKKGIRSIYNSAIYDIPRDLGRQVVLLIRDGLSAMAHPRSVSHCDFVKGQAQKLGQVLNKAADFVTCCAESHRGNFNSDLEVLRRALAALADIKPASPVDDIKAPAQELDEACQRLCKPADGKGAPPILSIQKRLAAAVDANLASLKGKTLSSQEQQAVESMQTHLDSSRQASSKILTLAQQNPVDTNAINALYPEVSQGCNEIVNAAIRVFPDGPTP